ncbi:MAG: hypothetical protein E7664_03020 [Ruminococcaceae bacterium]|nr:hypothetical protein [Oscillospiraceae bacterium]
MEQTTVPNTNVLSKMKQKAKSLTDTRFSMDYDLTLKIYSPSAGDAESCSHRWQGSEDCNLVRKLLGLGAIVAVMGISLSACRLLRK